MKIELKDRDVTMLGRIATITDYDYLSLLDTNNYIEVDDLLDILSDLEDAYIKLQEKFEEFEEKTQDSWETNHWGVEFNKGFKGTQYE